ncbi:hypothetical protein PSPO01_03901 [Paraphaeosphaeria sporulosa]
MTHSPSKQTPFPLINLPQKLFQDTDQTVSVRHLRARGQRMTLRGHSMSRTARGFPLSEPSDTKHVSLSIRGTSTAHRILAKKDLTAREVLGDTISTSTPNLAGQTVHIPDPLVTTRAAPLRTCSGK